MPEPLRREVGVAYLLFRIIDNFEDATRWQPEQRIAALQHFVRLMRDDTLDPTHAIAEWVREPPLEHAGYVELLRQTARVLEWHRALSPAAREHIREHLARTAEGMAAFVSRTNGSGALVLETLADLRDYCFVVAGIVGELLTELYLQHAPRLGAIAAELRARAVRFGEGLQLVNILKDAQPDAAEGRSYLPSALALDEVFDLAQSDLTAALEYAELLRTGQADAGIVAFNALNARLAVATLTALQDEGLGAKLTRAQVSELASEVMRRIGAGDSLLVNASVDH